MLLNRLNAICFEDNKEGDPGKTGGDPPKEVFSKEQITAIATVVNSAVSAHMGRQPKFEDSLKSVKWGELLAPVLKELVPTPDPKPGSGGKEPTELEKQILKLNNDFENERKLRIEAENKRNAAEEARRADAGKTKLRSLLTGKVVDGALDHAVNHLTLVQNRLSFDENGNPVIKVKRAQMPGFPPEEVEVSLEDGIKDILEEADLKIFLPVPKSNGGANPGPGGKGSQSSNSFTGEAKTEAEKLHRAMVREQELVAKYGNR
jgi:hypothetical protein